VERREADPERIPGRPLLRARQDPQLWGKVAALWHRERARDLYRAAGYEPHDARQRANDEALDIARRNGFRGGMPELKTELAALLDHRLDKGARRGRSTSRYWEDEVDDVLLHIVALEPSDLRTALKEFLLAEVSGAGPFTGKVGLYKLAYIVGFVPPLEELPRRNAFIEALSEVGQHTRCTEPGLFGVVFRLSRPYTLKSFEERLGLTGEQRRRWLPPWLRSEH
jgi:hypothetical protein